VLWTLSNEKLRIAVLDRLGLRPRSGFISVSAGGADAIGRALKRLKAEAVFGDYYEFGLYRGYTFWSAQRLALAVGFEGMRYFGFDSFQGLPNTSSKDHDNHMFFPGDYRASQNEVVGYLSDHGLDWSRATLIPGFFDSSLTSEVKRQHAMGPAALVMVDCDLYQSTVPVLSFVRDLIQNGTIILFDDWFCYGGSEDEGEPRALSEFLGGNPEWRAEHVFDYPRFGRAFAMRATGA
jgi:hypothetical protein